MLSSWKAKTPLRKAESNGVDCSVGHPWAIAQGKLSRKARLQGCLVWRHSHESPTVLSLEQDLLCLWRCPRRTEALRAGVLLCDMWNKDRSRPKRRGQPRFLGRGRASCSTAQEPDPEARGRSNNARGGQSAGRCEGNGETCPKARRLSERTGNWIEFKYLIQTPEKGAAWPIRAGFNPQS